MKRNLWIILILYSISSFSQVAENSYRLYLTDKNNSTFSINSPEEFLSQKSIERRNRFQIEITNNDLPVSQYYLDSLESLGLKILKSSKWLNTVVVFTNNKQLIDTIDHLGFVKSKQKTESQTRPSSKRYFLEKNKNSDLHVQNNYVDYGYATNQISMLNGHVLHLNNYKGEGITIGVIDAGFYNVDILPAFDSLYLNNQILGVRDFVDSDNEVYDASSHGMKVLSTIGGNIPGQLIGTAPKANFWLLRSEETASEYSIEEDNWVAAAEFADSVGCDIITSSLGYSHFDDPNSNYSYIDMNGNSAFITKGADIAASKGILVVNSAGNLGDDPWTYISAPADGDSVLTVGAVDAFASYVNFSSKGPTYDGRIKPNVAALGYQAAVQGINGDITVANGTSFSAPIIAGMAACLWQYYPELNNMEIFKKIEESAHQYSTPDYNIGYGIPDFAKAANLSFTNINSISENALIKIFPNPFKEYIQIELIQKNKREINISLFNVTGNKIFESSYSNLNSTIIEINHLKKLTPGIYLLKITIGKQIILKRISKI